MNNRQLAHVWAQQKKPRGKGSNFFFDGPRIYSYGAHYLAARFTDRRDENGARIVLVNNHQYSMSTARHLSYVRGALYGRNDVRVISVRDPRADGVPANMSGNLLDMRASYNGALQDAAHARTRSAEHLARAESIAADMRSLAFAFGADMPELQPYDRDAIRARIASQTAKEREAREERERAQRIIDAGAADKWRAGGPLENYRGAVTLLRVMGDRIETSRGAHVPLSVAPIVWRLVRETMRKGEPRTFERGAVALGEFSLDAIDANGNVTAGCHRLEFSELHRIAVRVGLN